MTEQELKNIIYKGERINAEYKKSESTVPKSAYESYSAFANTKGGYIILGVKEDKKKSSPEERYIIEGIANPKRQIEDFWNTVNGSKVNINILKDDDVFDIAIDGKTLVVIHVPRADYSSRPVFVGENPFKGSFKRNHEGDYHCTNEEVRAMIRDQNAEGNDGMVIEHYTMEDIDMDTLRAYRMRFQNENGEHIWNTYDDKRFLEMLGGYRKDRSKEIEGLTLAGIMMFGKGLVVREVFDNIFMDYRDESNKTADVRWNDRLTYDGAWENNVFNFLGKVMPKLTAELPKPFKLKGYTRDDDTPLHKAVREACVNMVIHADYLLEGTLKVIKTSDGFEITNPGILKIPVEQIFKGGNSKARNPRMQAMLRMVGFGDNVGSGFPTILKAWEEQGWQMPELIEDTVLNQVTLVLKMKPETGEMNENQNFVQKKERSLKEVLKEVLTAKDYEKMFPIIEYLDREASITTEIAGELTGKSATTAWRYLKKLVDAGIIEPTGNTNNAWYSLKQNKRL